MIKKQDENGIFRDIDPKTGEFIEETNTTNDDCEISAYEKCKAAHALNMCTVAVSQIVDFNDLYVLEEQYDTILNNLNLKEMPKDDALLTILTEMLNTITFFRIQDLKKEQIEKDYQRRLKNAVWSAIPSFNIFVSGSPIALVASIATTIGTGYMNYRREKYSAASEKERSEMELQITAIEQFDALRRELFTTAWRLAAKYDFADELRLTERQIHQYNEILMDFNELRKYVRLESIKDKFEAYAPFWYNLANSAMYIAETSSDEEVKKKYHSMALEYYEKYFSINDKYCILREDRTFSAAAIEYCDILIQEDAKKNKEKIMDLIDAAVSKAGNDLDILQLCAIEYLKFGMNIKAANLLKVLVNEDYNTTMNTKILSRLYVGICLHDGMDKGAYENYQLLKDMVPSLSLFPMPRIEELKDDATAKRLNDEYLDVQRKALKKDYMLTLHYIRRQYNDEFNSILPNIINDKADDFYRTLVMSVYAWGKMFSSYNMEDTKIDNDELAKIGYRYRYIDKLNQLIELLDILPSFRDSRNRIQYVKLIEVTIQSAREELGAYQKKMESKDLTYSDLYKLKTKYDFSYFTETFFGKLRRDITKYIDDCEDVFALETLELQIIDFCQINDFDIFSTSKNIITTESPVGALSYELLAKVSEKEVMYGSLYNKVAEKIKEYKKSLGTEEANTILLQVDVDNYFNQFERTEERIDAFNECVAVLSEPANDVDIIFAEDGFRIVKNKEIKNKRPYSLITKKLGKNELDLGYGDVYTPAIMDIDLLYDLIQTIRSID